MEKEEEAQKSALVAEIEWFKDQLEEQRKEALRLQQERKFEEALQLLRQIYPYTTAIEQDDILFISKRIERLQGIIEKEQEVYWKKQQAQQGLLDKLNEKAKDLIQQAREEPDYQKAFEAYYKPLLLEESYHKLEILQKLKSPSSSNYDPPLQRSLKTISK
jgi:hypothetical protein